MDYVIYWEANGEILRSYSGPENSVSDQLAEGEAAIEGIGSWLTHQVRDEMLIELDQLRQPEGDKTAWNPKNAEWFDPMQVDELRPVEMQRRRAAIQDQILALEARRQRPLWEITEAWMAGEDPPQKASSIAIELSASIKTLRGQLAELTRAP